MTLAARGLAFGYDGRPLGRDLDLEVRRGEVVCVLGPNGAGKSTLLRTLLGLVAPIAGQVTLDGRELASMPRAAVARCLAYVPQASLAPFEFTLAETVEMGRTAHLGAFGAPGPADRDAARDALTRLGIGALADRSLDAVSGGERQLACVARALATGATLLVMDEPTANLDFGNQQRVLAEVARLREAGIGILLCTHDPDHAMQVADRALLLSAGQAQAQGNCAEILTAQNLARLYGVSVHVTEVQTPAGPRRVCVAAPW